MEEEKSSSWVMRAKFSHTVWHRWDNSRLPTFPFYVKSRSDLSESSLDVDPGCLRSNLDPLDFPKSLSSSVSTRPSKFQISAEDSKKPGIGVGILKKLFSRKQTHNSVFASPSDMSTGRHSQSLRKAIRQTKDQKETTWTRYFDSVHAGFSAMEIPEHWRIDLSKLYIGLRFACGAHSRLHHGIYEDQPVAVKIISPPDDDDNGAIAVQIEHQFSREVALLSHLSHQNVIELVGACRTPVLCILTEYLSGGSLRDFCHKLQHKPVPLLKLITIALDIARGMEYIHSQGIIHCDLKPQNILFDRNCRGKIADFGIACEAADYDASAEDLGTLRWMAPELMDKHKPFDRKVDVYSFGLILCEMVTGAIPYEELTPYQAAFAVSDKNLRPAIPYDCPQALRVLIRRCWALLPEKRPEFWEIVKILEQFESAYERDGTIDNVQNQMLQEHNKKILNWIQKLKHSRADHS